MPNLVCPQCDWKQLIHDKVKDEWRCPKCGFTEGTRNQ